MISYHPLRDEIANKISITLKQKYASGEIISCDVSGKNNPMYGKNHTEETKKKISDYLINFYSENGFNRECYRKNKTFEELFSPEESTRLKNILSESGKKRTRR